MLASFQSIERCNVGSWRKTKQWKNHSSTVFTQLWILWTMIMIQLNSEANIREIVSHFWLYLRCSPQEEAHIWYCKSSHDFANQTQYRTPLHICSSVNRLVQLSDIVREVLCATDSGQCKNSQLDKVQRISCNGVLRHKWNIYIASLPLKFRPHKGRRHGKILRVCMKLQHLLEMTGHLYSWTPNSSGCHHSIMGWQDHNPQPKRRSLLTDDDC